MFSRAALLALCIALFACADGSHTPDNPGSGTPPPSPPPSDTTAPTVQSTNPTNNASAISAAASLSAVFSEPLATTSVNSDNVLVSGGVSGTVSLNGATVTFTPSAALMANTRYTVTLRGGAGGIRDLAGNVLAQDYQWSFTTAAAADTTPPTVQSTSPSNNATGVNTATNISAVFSEPLAAASVNATNVSVSGGVTGIVSLNGATVSFTPSAALTANTRYTVTIRGGTSGIRDLAGNALAQDFQWSFTTAAAADTTPPTVQSTSPASNATGVNTTTSLSAVFSEPLAAASVNATNVTVSGGVSGTVSLSSATVTFTPGAPLTANTRYTVTLKGGAGGVRDLAGNPLAQDYLWSFTTAAATAGNCADPNILCVDDTPGPTQEYATIQAAVSAAQAGQTVLVYDGNYAGFRVDRSGNPSAPIVVRAQGSNALINSDGPTGDGIRLENVSHVTIDGFAIQNVSQRCIAARGATATAPMTGNVISNNRCTNAGVECFYLSQFGNARIENNVITGCGVGGTQRQHGLYLANAGSDNTVVRGNRISGANKPESNGMHFNGDASIGGDGMIGGLTIENNIVFNNAQSGFNMDGVEDSTVRNNLVYGNGRHALRAYRIDAQAGPRNLRIVNNSFVGGSNGWAVKLSEDRGGHVLFNNILLGGSGSLSVAHTNVTSNNNIVDDRLSPNDEASILSLAQWTASTGQDGSSRVSNAAALFANTGTGDYRLKTTAPISPAIDAGRVTLGNITAPSTDSAGATRPQGNAHDAGAYESSASGGGGGGGGGGTAGTRYLAPAPSGNDANPGTQAQPWATFRHAFSRMNGGETLIVKNGTYNQNLGEWQFQGNNLVPTSKPPNGTPSAHTIVRGETVGGVTINGAMSIVGTSYVNVEQFTFLQESMVDGGSRFVEVRRCGFRGGISTSRSSYIIKEDIWAWGGNRYVISNYQSDYVLDHRVIARLDNIGAVPTLPVGAISHYETNHSVIAHGLFFDVNGSFQQPFALVYSSRPAIGMNRLYGIIGFNAGAQLSGIFPGDGGGGGHEIKNSVVHGTRGYGVNFNSPGPNQVLNSTIFGNSGAAVSGQNNVSAHNNIFFNNGGMSASITACSNNLLVSSGSMGSCSGNDTTTTPNIQYLPRSPIAGKGATIEKRYSISFSNGGYVITETSDALWPWPHEDVIRRDMCSTTSYGWCGTNKSLTRYIWEYLGNPCPSGICSGS